MKTFSVRVRVRYKEGILDPQAEAVFAALKRLDFEGLRRVECDKLFLLELDAASEGEAVGKAHEMATKLLASPVMENFEVEVVTP